MAIITNVAPDTQGSNCSSPARCTRCGTSATVRPYRSKKGCTGLTQLAVSPKTAIRQKLRRLIHDSRLPHSEFSQYVLGCDEITVYRYLKGDQIPRSKMTYLQNIEAVTRTGAAIHITIRTCAERPRWRAMLHRRARDAGTPYAPESP